MSLISFGLKAPRSKRKVASTLSAFAEPEPDEPAPALSEAQTLSESDRLQVIQKTCYNSFTLFKAFVGKVVPDMLSLTALCSLPRFFSLHCCI